MKLNSRILKTNKTYHSLNKGLISMKEVSKETKMKVYKSIDTLDYNKKTST